MDASMDCNYEWPIQQIFNYLGGGVLEIFKYFFWGEPFLGLFETYMVAFLEPF